MTCMNKFSLFFAFLALFGPELIIVFQLLKEGFEPVHFVEGVVEVKLEVGNPAHVLFDAMSQGLAQPGIAVLHFQNDGLLVLRVVDAEVYPGDIQIRAHFDIRNRYKGGGSEDIRSFLLQEQSEIPLYQFCDLRHALGFHNHHLI